VEVQPSRRLKPARYSERHLVVIATGVKLLLPDHIVAQAHMSRDSDRTVDRVVQVFGPRPYEPSLMVVLLSQMRVDLSQQALHSKVI
jgi:hypothetical protein